MSASERGLQLLTSCVNKAMMSFLKEEEMRGGHLNSTAANWRKTHETQKPPQHRVIKSFLVIFRKKKCNNKMRNKTLLLLKCECTQHRICFVASTVQSARCDVMSRVSQKSLTSAESAWKTSFGRPSTANNRIWKQSLWFLVYFLYFTLKIVKLYDSWIQKFSSQLSNTPIFCKISDCRNDTQFTMIRELN